MSSDFERRVTGIQGNHVSNETPSDGYVLTWSDASQQWVGQSPRFSNQLTFTSDGYWACPPNIHFVIANGMGGGGNGGTGMAGGEGSAGTNGGIGAIMSTQPILVTPNATYFITIGNGGENTTFHTFTWLAGLDNVYLGGDGLDGLDGYNYAENDLTPGGGGFSGGLSNAGVSGVGHGGNGGGNTTETMIGGNGTDGAPNSGNGGGGGGGGGMDNYVTGGPGGLGGQGGSGSLTIIW